MGSRVAELRPELSLDIERRWLPRGPTILSPARRTSALTVDVQEGDDELLARPVGALFTLLASTPPVTGRVLWKALFARASGPEPRSLRRAQ